MHFIFFPSCTRHFDSLTFYAHLWTLRKGNVFTSVYQSFGPEHVGGGGHAWWRVFGVRGMHVGSMHGTLSRGMCGGVHYGGHAWQGHFSLNSGKKSHLPLFICIHNKNAFQYNAYHLCIDCIPWFSVSLGGGGELVCLPWGGGSVFLGVCIARRAEPPPPVGRPPRRQTPGRQTPLNRQIHVKIKSSLASLSRQNLF